jgi:YD repeat-containing protein
MKMKYFKIILTIAIFFLGNLSPAFAALQAHPVAKPPMNQRDKHSTDLFTGSANYSYPISVPKGTNDLTPEVFLSYSSAGVRDLAQSSGAGWQVSRNYIERDVNNTPTNTNDDKYKLHFKGQTHDLVFVSGDSRYHTKIQSNLHIQKLNTGAQNEKTEYWQVIEKDGTKYRFGFSQNSELVCDGRSYVFRWNLDEVADTHNNKIFHTYTESNGLSYLSKTEYNNDKRRKVDFVYDTHPYQRQAYQQGCNTKEISRLKSIQVRVDTSLIRQYDLAYTQAASGQQLMQSITEKGNDGVSLPPTKFEYHPEVAAWNLQYTSWTSAIDAALQSNETTVADMNGDGLTDVVRSVNHGGPNNEWRVFVNTGTSFNSQYVTWVNPIDASLQSGVVRLLDVNGDGLTDVVRSVNHGGPNNEWRVFKNNGKTLNKQYETWANPIDAAINSSEVTLADVNGDNLPEIIRSVNHGGPNNEWRVYINTGASWNPQYQVWANPIDVALQSSEDALADVNGDGLSDIIRSVNHGGPNNEWRVYINSGASWNPQYQVWVNPIDAALQSGEVALADANGDGLPDIVRAANQGGSNNQWRVFRNTGSGWSTQYQVWASSIDASIISNETALAEITGDGLVDVVRSVNHGGPNNEWRVFKNNGQAMNLISAVVTPQGGRIIFDYTRSTKYVNTNEDNIPDLPFALWVVEKMTVNNGMVSEHATNDVTTYAYKDGYYKWQEKEFRGFGTVEESLPGATNKKYVFYQDDGRKGRLVEAQTRDNQNNPFAETEHVWSNNQSNGIFTVNLTQEKQYTYDGTPDNPKVVQTDYAYDIYGNITKKSELGDIGATGDERFSYNEYTYNTSSWIVDRANRTHRNDSDDYTKVSETYFYYDGNIGLNDTPTKGDVTKEVKWLNTLGSANPTTVYEYDNYGNITKIIDARSNSTTYSFGTTDNTFTYPDSETNAKNQTTSFVYDLGSGNLLSKTGPNGFITSYEYDSFGRVIKEIQPYDSSDYPTLSYSYFNDGIAPEGMLVSKLETSSSSATLDTYTITDGLGRKIQTRRDAEDTAKQIVAETFYNSIGEINKETVPYLVTSSAITTTPTPTPAPTKFGDGRDGDLTIAANTTEIPIDSSVTATAGNNTATVGSGLAFAKNQIVLFHQTRGTNAGLWEFARVQSYNGTTLTLTTSLANSYSSASANRAQVRVVRQYRNVTVNSGVTWTAKSWNGTTGGVLAFLASGNVNISGIIFANGKTGSTANDNAAGGYGIGYYGGIGRGGSGQQAQAGEGIPGGAVAKSSANGNGGGGGRGPGGTTPNAGGSGGGGGDGTAGASGTIAGNGGTPGAGGTSAGNAGLTVMVFGGGGGGGGNNVYESSGTGGGGGGAGIVFLNGKSINVTGAIRSNGGSGGNGWRSGGGGAGGSILIKGEDVVLGSSLVTALAGSGGTMGTKGGNGAVGRIVIQYENSLTGSTNPLASSTQNQIPLLPPEFSEPQPPYDPYIAPDLGAKYTELTYDPLSRVTVVKNPKGDSKTVAYDHWKETIIDENGHIKRSFENAYGKVSKIEEVNDLYTYTTIYTYSARDELTKITDHQGNNLEFSYDSLGRKTSQNDPDLGQILYTYDGVDNVLSEKDARNITVNKTYDQLNRITKVDYPNDTDTIYTYDGNSMLGTLTSVTDGAGSVEYTYDNRLRKIKEQRIMDDIAWITEFTYDSANRIITKKNPNGEIVTNTFNSQGEVESVNGVLGNVDYNAQGKITKKVFANNLTTNFTYNTDDFRLGNIKTGSIFDKNYNYDKVGNITTINDNLLSKTQTFGYDNLDRLVSASESAGFNYSYEYNPIGNLIKFINDAITIKYTYGQNAGVHALTSSSE